MKKQYFLLLAIFTFYLANAQNIVVSGAGTVAVNGTYILDGTYNGKSKYVKDDNPDMILRWSCDWACDGWNIIDVMMFNTYYYSEDDVATPDLATTWQRGFGSNPVPTIEVEGKSISFSTNAFIEKQSTNNGSIGNTITISYNGFGGDFFTGSNGENFISAGKVNVSNVPAGLTASIVKQSNTQLLFTLSGSATSHANANDISNLTVTFDNSAFDQGDATTVYNYSKSDLEVNFIQVITVASSGADYTTVNAAVTAADDYDIITIAGETFTLSSTIDIDKSLWIKGQGVGQTIIQGNTEVTTAGPSRRLIEAINGEVLSIQDITFRYAHVTFALPAGSLYFEAFDSININRCHFTGNRATASNCQGGGIYTNSGKLVVSNCLFNDNAITNAQFGAGGSAIACYNSTVTIVSSTFNNNNVNRVSSAPYGGTVLLDGGSLELVNSTFTGNEGYLGGGISSNNATTNITNSILYGNTASSAGPDLYRNGGTVNVTNSIIGASAAASGSAVNGTSSNLSSADPLLNALADNGGPTQTISIQAGSPAIEAGIVNSFTPFTDQRGKIRNTISTIGAYEFNAINGIGWTGNEDTDWANPNNWTLLAVPTDNDDVVLLSNNNQPTINSNPNSPALTNNLTVNSGVTLTISEGKALTVKGNLENNGSLTLKSDVSGSATLIVDGTISGSGTYTVEQYLAGSNRNYYIGSPVSNATAAVFNNGTHSKFSHNTAEQRYYTLANGTTLNPGQGYVYRGTNAQTVEFTGVLNNSDLDIDITDEGNGNPFDGYNLIANPFTAYIDFKQANIDRVDASIWFRAFNGANNVFDTYNRDSEIGTNNNGAGAVNEFIPPLQGFWVKKVGPGTGTFSFEKSNRSHQTGTLRKPQQQNIFRFNISKDGVSDEAVINFTPNAEEEVESYDSRKMYSNIQAQVATVVNNQDLVINSLPSYYDASVPAKVKFTEAGLYTLSATQQSGELQNTPVVLEDLLTKQKVSFNAGETYTFKGNKDDANRFVIHFGDIPLSVNNTSAIAPIVFANNKLITVKLAEANNAQATIYNVSGQLVQTVNVTNTFTQINSNLPSGVYVVEINNGGTITREKVVIQ